MQLSDKIDITPFARILPFFAAGILAFRYVTAPDWLIVAAMPSHGGSVKVPAGGGRWLSRSSFRGYWLRP